ncbi:hypothetical protein P691DRAFT_613355, partial [Macrolepiota fuliginosa MF-IS2]
YLIATALEDWLLVLGACDQVSESENNAREAVDVFRREFQYGEPTGQLSAARFWAIMFKNCSNTFGSQTADRWFLGIVEELVIDPESSPAVRGQLLYVIATIASASGSSVSTTPGTGVQGSFQALWTRVKP